MIVAPARLARCPLRCDRIVDTVDEVSVVARRAHNFHWPGTLSDGTLEHAPLEPLVEKVLLGVLTCLLALATLNVLRAALIRATFGNEVYGTGVCGEKDSDDYNLIFLIMKLN